MTVAVPFIDLSRAIGPHRAAVEAAWSGCLERCEFVGGASVERFEQALGRMLSVKHVAACANGTDALILALQGVGVGPGDLVAIPNLTFWATYEAVVQVGARPVLIDVDPIDLQADKGDLLKALDRYPCKAVILVHLFGWASQSLGEIRQACRDRGVHLIEDAAQAVGVLWRNASIVVGAEVATCSFYPAKVLGGAMDGGAVVCESPEVLRRIQGLRNHGRRDHYSYDQVGWNSRMSGLQGSFLEIMLPSLESFVEERMAQVRRYQGAARERNWGKVLTMVDSPEMFRSNGYLAVFRLGRHDPEDFQRRLREFGIGTARTYPQTMDMQAPAAGALRVSDLGRSRRFCQEVINLPVFVGMTGEEQDAVFNAVDHVIAGLESR